MKPATQATNAFAAIACGGQGTDLKDSTLDAGPINGGDGQAGGGSFTDPFAGAPAYVKPSKQGNAHNPGRSCGDKGCHGSGGEGPAFLIGGTIYTDYAGTTPAVGVEIRVVDTNNNAASTYSDSVGNFYIRSGSSSVALPAYVGARDGNISRPMVTQLTGGMGSCNQATCHATGGYGPIHIP